MTTTNRRFAVWVCCYLGGLWLPTFVGHPPSFTAIVVSVVVVAVASVVVDLVKGFRR